METDDWYQQLMKPSWAPPSWLFGPVWTVLYVLIAISFGYAAYLYFKKKISFFIFLPFILNLVFNLSFTPLQFGLKNNFLAAIDVVLVLTTLMWALRVMYGHVKWIVFVNIPYLLWVCFATVLQLTITILN